MVGIPWSMYQTGIPFGLIINFVIACLVQYSCSLYLEAKSNIPIAVTSIYELSYICLDRAGIFIVSSMQLITAFGMNIIYFIVFGDAASSTVQLLVFPG